MSKIKSPPTTWNLSALASGLDDPRFTKERVAIQKAHQQFAATWQKRTDYLEQPNKLKQALDELEALTHHYGSSGNEGYYLSLRLALNQSDHTLKARANLVTELANRQENSIRFFLLNLSRLPRGMQRLMLSASVLKPYRHYLERLFAWSPYLLSEPEENLINLKGQSAHGFWIRMTSEFLSQAERTVIDEQGKKKVCNLMQLDSLFASQRKKVRDHAAVAFNSIVAEYAAVAEHELNAILHDKKVEDQLRHLPRPDLTRHLNDDIDSAIVDTMIQSVGNQFAISHRFYRLKAQLLGQKKLAYHERLIDYGTIKPTYTFQKTTQLIDRVFHRLDPEFSAIFNRLLTSGQIDVWPKKGKSGGAFCAYNLKTQPTYILLNHTNRLDNVLTLAHELGHAINDELMKEQQALNFDTPLSTAEVASTFMEDFVLQELLQQSDDQTKLSLMMQKLDSDIATIFRQVACYQFEQQLHHAFRAEGYLSTAAIGQLFQTHMKAYMGPSVEQSPGSERWWVAWGHIRRFFYVYSYASGLLISKALQAKVKQDPMFIHQVKTLLSAGSSQSPAKLFQSIGLNINEPHLWQSGIAEVAQLLSETEKLAKKVSIR